MKPTKLWAGLGISEEKVLAAVDVHCQPRDDVRTGVIRRIFGDSSLRDATLRQPLYDNAMKILAHLENLPGGVVVLGDRLGSKSQTLSYLEGLCHTIKQLNPVHFLVLRISFKEHTPRGWKDLFGLLQEDIFSALLPLCRSFLKAELEKTLGTPAPDFPADEYKEFDVATRKTVAHRAYSLLMAHVGFRAAKTETNFWSLYHAMIALLKHDEQTLCYSLFLIDEAGEALDPALSTSRAAMFREFLQPLKIVVGKNASQIPRRYSIVFCGSTSMNRLKYFSNRFCRLNRFDAAQCSALWEQWKAHAKKTEEEKMAAEKWMGDLSSTSKEEKFGEALLDLTDGVPGCLVDLFCEAFGHKSPDSLANLVTTHYNGLKAIFLGRGSGARVVDDVVNAIELKNWGLFADHGLSPSPHDAPSAPVMRILFALCRGDKIVDYYGRMLSAMAQLNHSSGSFEVAVFEEQVRHRLLRGSGFRVSKMSKSVASKAKKRKGTEVTTPGEWIEEEFKVMFTSPAQMVTFTQNGFFDQQPKFDASEFGTVVENPAEKNDCLFLFSPEGQTFPSIDMSIAEVRKKGKQIDVDVYHISVSIGTKHFATFDGVSWSKTGHLPLSLGSKPPTILRSPTAQTQLRFFRKELKSFFNKANINHHYAVANDHATDLASLPTTEFDKDFFVMNFEP